jgi:hypothetical protein
VVEPRRSMETTAKRTLVKSAPELWELADDEARMQVWMAGVVGATGTIGVEVTDREPERMLAWQTANGGTFGRIALHMTEKGFGTAVVITAHHQGAEPGAATALENLLDELGSPERQPFARD